MDSLSTPEHSGLAMMQRDSLESGGFRGFSDKPAR
jgi:hypothetical protein